MKMEYDSFGYDGGGFYRILKDGYEHHLTLRAEMFGGFSEKCGV
jgi:hypothetical protein